MAAGGILYLGRHFCSQGQAVNQQHAFFFCWCWRTATPWCCFIVFLFQFDILLYKSLRILLRRHLAETIPNPLVFFQRSFFGPPKISSEVILLGWCFFLGEGNCFLCI